MRINRIQLSACGFCLALTSDRQPVELRASSWASRRTAGRCTLGSRWASADAQAVGWLRSTCADREAVSSLRQFHLRRPPR